MKNKVFSGFTENYLQPPVDEEDQRWVDALNEALTKAAFDMQLYGTGFVKIDVETGSKLPSVNYYDVFKDCLITLPEGFSLDLSKLELGCTHEWQHYEGITNRFDFCTKCDVKKDA
jgi:hypothetical protein